MFVVYCKDRDSQNLPPNQFYNTKLHSINQHATLSKLKKKDRVFSVYETLHPQQVKLLENCFKQLWLWYLCCEVFFFILNHVDYSDFGICNLIFYSFIILLIMKIIFSWRVALSAKAASLCCVFQITRELRSLNVLYPANTFPRLIHILPFYLKLMLIFLSSSTKGQILFSGV